MADILHDLPIRAPIDRVFQAVSTPQGLDCWWTERSKGNPQLGAEYELSFGPEFNWRATVVRCATNSEFELKILHADNDWLGTLVGIRLEERNDVT